MNSIPLAYAKVGAENQIRGIIFNAGIRWALITL